MKVFKKKIRGSRLSRPEALKSTPVKSTHITEDRLESGEVVIHYPEIMQPWIAGLVKRLGGKHDRIRIKKLQLDVLGTAVWDLMDGKRSVRRVIAVFAEIHRLQRREAEVAVTQFMRELGRRGLIGLQ